MPLRKLIELHIILRVTLMRGLGGFMFMMFLLLVVGSSFSMIFRALFSIYPSSFEVFFWASNPPHFQKKNLCRVSYSKALQAKAKKNNQQGIGWNRVDVIGTAGKKVVKGVWGYFFLAPLVVSIWITNQPTKEIIFRIRNMINWVVWVESIQVPKVIPRTLCNIMFRFPCFKVQ